MTREEERILYRLRSGHYSINLHLHKIGIKETDLCETCLKVDSVHHHILECSKYDILRGSMIEKMRENKLEDFSLKNILSGKKNALGPLMEYIKKTKNVV